MKGLSAKQAQVLAFIAETIARRGYAPTRREIAARFDLGSTNAVADYERALVRKGFLTRNTAQHRGLRLALPRHVAPADAITAAPSLVLADVGLALYWPIAASDPVGELPLAHAS